MIFYDFILYNGFELTIYVKLKDLLWGIILRIIKFTEFRQIREYDPFSSWFIFQGFYLEYLYEKTQGNNLK